MPWSKFEDAPRTKWATWDTTLSDFQALANASWKKSESLESFMMRFKQLVTEAGASVSTTTAKEILREIMNTSPEATKDEIGYKLANHSCESLQDYYYQLERIVQITASLQRTNGQPVKIASAGSTWCRNCRKDNHDTRDCRKSRGRTDDRRSRSRTRDSNQSRDRSKNRFVSQPVHELRSLPTPTPNWVTPARTSSSAPLVHNSFGRRLRKTLQPFLKPANLAVSKNTTAARPLGFCGASRSLQTNGARSLRTL